MVYAPVIIPTLNRYTHLERLVESLKRNSFAKDTEVYISVDYPPSDKYVDGYKKVCDYVKTIDGFKKVTLFFQEKNLGAYDNFEFLKKEIAERFDRYIFTEDDNEFSPCFLEYMDKCLERFEFSPEIQSIAAVGGLNFKASRYTSNYVIKNRTSPYGSGTWVNKEARITSNELEVLFNEVIYSFVLQWKLFKVNGSALTYIAHDLMGEIPAMRDARGKLAVMDYNRHIYYIMKGKYAIFPVVPLVRNWGYDGSGVNSVSETRSAEDTLKVNISTSASFSFIEPTNQDVTMWSRNNRYFGFFRDIKFKDAIRSFLIIEARRFLDDKSFERFKKIIKRRTTRNEQSKA